MYGSSKPKIAGHSQLGVVKIGSGINIAPDGTISATGGGGGGGGDMYKSTYDPAGGSRQVAFANQIPTKVSTLTNDAGYISSETDPTVPSWAKQPTKPSYTAAEVGALPSSTVIPTVPTNVSAFNNDAGYITSEMDPTVPAWAKTANKPTYTASEVGALPDTTFIPEGVQIERLPSAFDSTGDSGYSRLYWSWGQKRAYIFNGSAFEAVSITSTNGLTNDSGFITEDDIPTEVSAFDNDAGYLTAETDPTVPTWAKQPSKPSYTASEVGALPDTTVIPTVPTNVSAFNNDAGYLTAETDPTVPAWAKTPTKPSYTASEVGALPNTTVIPTVPTQISAFNNDAGYLTTETDPTVPAWAKAANKPTYTASEVGALPDTTVIPEGVQIERLPNAFDSEGDSGYERLYWAWGQKRAYIFNGSAFEAVSVTATSGLTNDSGFITDADIPTEVFEVEYAIVASRTPVSDIIAAYDEGKFVYFKNGSAVYIAYGKEVQGGFDSSTKAVLFIGTDYDTHTISKAKAQLKSVWTDPEWVFSNTDILVSGDVSVSQTLTSGTEIGSITVEGTETKLYAPSGSSTGDMQSTVYDPAGGARQVAFADQIPTIPTNVSAFNNDAGYVTKRPGYASTTVSIKIGSTTRNPTLHKYGRIVNITYNGIFAFPATSTTYTVGTIPEGFRPITTVYGHVLGSSGSGNFSEARISIATNGTISMFANNTSNREWNYDLTWIVSESDEAFA